MSTAVNLRTLADLRQYESEHGLVRDYSRNLQRLQESSTDEGYSLVVEIPGVVRTSNVEAALIWLCHDHGWSMAFSLEPALNPYKGVVRIQIPGYCFGISCEEKLTELADDLYRGMDFRVTQIGEMKGKFDLTHLPELRIDPPIKTVMPRPGFGTITGEFRSTRHP